MRVSRAAAELTRGQLCTDLWVMNADGSNEVNLTSTPNINEDQPAWSPDGTRIAFTSDRNDLAGVTDIWVIGADGSNQTNLTPTIGGADNFHEYR